jgi:hypothetical protein
MTILRRVNRNFINRFYSTIIEKSANKETIKVYIPNKVVKDDYILKEVPKYMISDNDVIFVSIEKDNKDNDKYMEFNTYN